MTDDLYARGKAAAERVAAEQRVKHNGHNVVSEDEKLQDEGE